MSDKKEREILLQLLANHDRMARALDILLEAIRSDPALRTAIDRSAALADDAPLIQDLPYRVSLYKRHAQFVRGELLFERRAVPRTVGVDDEAAEPADDQRED